MQSTQKKTVVLGASNNPSRYSFVATQRLNAKNYEVVPIGNRDGEINGIQIIKDTPDIENVHTVTLYLNPTRQEAYYDYILGLNPKRIIFNPGTENPVLAKKAKEKEIEVVIGCTLVMLSVGNF